MIALVVPALRATFAGVRSHVSVCRWFSSSSAGRLSPERLVSVATVRSLLEKEKLKFVDVRAPEQYSSGHIPDAVNIREIFTYLATSDPQGVEELRTTFEDLFQEAGINGDELVITYEDCLKTKNVSSYRGYYLLKLLGHPNVSVLNGGLEAWKMCGLPVSTVVPKVTKGTFKASWVDSMWSSKDDVAVAMKEKSAVLLDVRDTDEWKAKTSSPLNYGTDFAPRKGRLPGAVHMHWKDFMRTTEDGLTYLREPEEVREMCAARAGLLPESKVIVYCFKGARASNTFIALKEAGFSNVTNYFGSWNEWSRDHSLEIDSRKLE